MHNSLMHRSRHWVLFPALLVSFAGCKRSDTTPANTQANTLPGAPATPDSAAGAVASPSDGGAAAPLMLRGTVASVSSTELVLNTDSGTTTVKLDQPFNLYTRAAGKLSMVTDSSFIGVTSVKQPDGSERATEIHVFPEDLRGLGEGSHMMTPDTSAAGNRMTNGTASPAPAAAPSRMSNGSVSSTNGSTLIVQYAGGSQTITVPPTTPVTHFTLSSKPPRAGEQLVVLATRAADGSLTSSKGLTTKQ
ncbi:MAG TPA: hypothetical protein VGM67_08330 [Gemmatimonadaceae bacterium]|jgi:hypothetical protein